MHLLLQGHTLEYIDNLPGTELRKAYLMYSRGPSSPFIAIKSGYTDYVHQHQAIQNFIQANSKKHTHKKAASFSEMFPDEAAFMGLNQEKKDNNIARQLAYALPMEGAPQWLKDKLAEDVNASTSPRKTGASRK